MESWKTEIGEKALKAGIIKDPSMLERLDESMPLWAVLEMLLGVIERIDPPTFSYD